MLTMVNPLNIEGHTVYQDDGNEVDALLSNAGPRVGVPPVRRFYVMPEKPTIAKDDSGKPIFSLIVYRHDEERLDPLTALTKDVGGGILTFTVELSIPKPTLDLIRKRLRTKVFGDTNDPADDVELSYVPFLEGKVAVAVAGESGTEVGDDREFVKNTVGAGKVGGIGQNRKAVMVKLTQAGSSLMSQISRLNTLPINVQYELPFEHRLLGVSMRVWCDMSSSYTLIQETLHASDEYDDGYLGLSSNHVPIDKVTSVTEILVRSKTAGVTVIPQSSLVDNDTLMSLEKFGFELLNKEMNNALQASPPPETLDRTYIEEFIADFSSNFNFSLDRRMVLSRTHTPSANIASVFKDADFDSLVTFVDLRTGFFSFLKIPIRVNADFTVLPLDSVTVTVIYQRQRIGGGGREERIDSFNFKDGSAIQTFLAYANSLADVTYDWEAMVHYKGSQETFRFKQTRVKDDFLVVDVGMLGILAVDIGLGLVDLDKFPQAKLSLRYHSRARNRTLQQDFVLNKEQHTARWTEVIQEEPTGGYEYKVDFLKKDGDILTGQWIKTTAAKLRVDAPIPDQLEVSIVCTGNFKDGDDQIAQVAVRLRYEDPGNQYTQEGQVVFTQENQNLPWRIDLRDPQKRDYLYNYTIIYKDGVIRNRPENGGWLSGEPGFITVGEKYSLEVDLYPTLLTYPEHAKLVQLDMKYADEANGILERDSFVFTKETSTPKAWRVRGKPGGPKRFSYVVKYYSAAGAVVSLPPIVSEAEAVVIPPMAAGSVSPAPTG